VQSNFNIYQEIVMVFKVNRSKLYEDLERVCTAGLGLLEKDSFEASDYNKLKSMKAMASFFNARVAIVQQENATERIELIRQRMKQLGYEGAPQVTG
jgi:hypothetical protein